MQLKACRSSSGASADTQQPGSDTSDILSSDLQDLAQSNDGLSASLNDEQQGAVASKMRDLAKKTKEMTVFGSTAEIEMNNPEADPKVLLEQTKKLAKLSKGIKTQQHEVAAALGIAA
jgi:hypothetical protein